MPMGRILPLTATIPSAAIIARLFCRANLLKHPRDAEKVPGKKKIYPGRVPEAETVPGCTINIYMRQGRI